MIVGQVFPDVGRRFPYLRNFGQLLGTLWPKSAQLWPKSVNCGRNRQLVAISAAFDQPVRGATLQSGARSQTHGEFAASRRDRLACTCCMCLAEAHALHDVHAASSAGRVWRRAPVCDSMRKRACGRICVCENMAGGACRASRCRRRSGSTVGRCCRESAVGCKCERLKISENVCAVCPRFRAKRHLSRTQSDFRLKAKSRVNNSTTKKRQNKFSMTMNAGCASTRVLALFKSASKDIQRALSAIAVMEAVSKASLRDTRWQTPSSL